MREMLTFLSLKCALCCAHCYVKRFWSLVKFVHSHHAVPSVVNTSSVLCLGPHMLNKDFDFCVFYNSVALEKSSPT
uniref:Putative secreted protein n=1 Tax=Rhipicephalus microplus TaxID=6941 RepID=A0A6M2DAR6_RHIMP